jgi:hypothetical protein
MPVAFVIGVIILIVVFLAVYFMPEKTETAPPPQAEKREEPKPAKSDETIDPFKSAVPPKD